MKMLSLFSGIGGIDLAAEWAGIETVAFCEIAEFPVKVLKKNWPGVPIYNDVRKITKQTLENDKINAVDIVAGGFPCQPFSSAGNRKGQNDERYLWDEMLRIVDELRPRWVLGENVSGLLSIDNVSRTGGGTFGIILRDLAELGYRVGWSCYGACHIGAPHERQRVFILANATSIGRPILSESISQFAESKNHPGNWNERLLVKPELQRVVNGIPSKLDKCRLKAIGNAVVPQQIYPIFAAIMAIENAE